MQTIQAYYQAFYVKTSDKHVIDVYRRGEFVKTFPYDAKTSLKDAVTNFGRELAAEGSARIHLHSNRHENNFQAQKALDELAQETGRVVRIQDSDASVWIGGPSTAPQTPVRQ